MGSRKDWKKTKEIHWSDEKHQDFNEIGLKRKGIPEGFKYKHTSKWYWFFSNLLYYGVAKWIIGFYVYSHGIRCKNKAVLKKLNGKGAFIYSNHVAISDCFKFNIVIARRVDTIGYSDALSIPVGGKLATLLGLIPLPLKEDRDNFHKMTEAISYNVKERNHYCLIFPEAHIWPYYTEIRNWPNNSLIYPALMMMPIVPAVTVWKKRLIGKKPKQLIVFGEPIYPKEGESITYNKDYLHQECIASMKEIARTNEQVQYIKYIKDE